MSAPISIVIPTLNAEKELPATLLSLMEGVHAGLIRELIVTDGGSTDQTLKIADEAGAEIVVGAASRGGQLRRGCDAARGEWLMVLHADTQLQSDWTTTVAGHLSSKSPAVFKLSFRARGFGPFWVAGWANLRSRLFGLPYGDQGLLVPRRAYSATGGFPDQPLMEDVALIRSLPRARLLPVRVFTSAERYSREGWIRRGSRNLWTLVRYYLGVDPEKLARSYRR